MLIFDDNHTVGDAISQKIFHRFCHGCDGFAGADDQNSIIIFKIEPPLADDEQIIIQSYMANDSFHRIHRLQSRLKNLHGVLSHLSDI